jgi:hypothetical protein
MTNSASAQWKATGIAPSRQKSAPFAWMFTASLMAITKK